MDTAGNKGKCTFWKNPGFWKRLAVIVILLSFCAVHYVMKVKDVPAYHDVLSSSIDGSVTVPFNRITGFEIMVHNEEAAGYLDANELLLNVWIEDEAGRTIWKGSLKM